MLRRNRQKFMHRRRKLFLEPLEERSMLTLLWDGGIDQFYCDLNSFVRNPSSGEVVQSTFTHSLPTMFKIVDFGFEGEQFELYDFGTLIGTTSTPWSPDYSDPFILYPGSAYYYTQLEQRGFSTGEFLLAAGEHSLTIKLIATGSGPDISRGIGFARHFEIPILSINDVTVQEDAGALAFTVSIERTIGNVVQVNYTTEAGTAQSNDYTAQSGTLTFDVYYSGGPVPGPSTQVITVPIANDLDSEPAETIFINLENVSGGAPDWFARPVILTDSQGKGTILRTTNPPNPFPLPVQAAARAVAI